MQMNLIIAGRKPAWIERDVDRDHFALVSIAPDEQGDEAVEGRNFDQRIDTAGIAMTRGAVPEMKAARERGMARGGEGAGITGFGANHDGVHENKGRTDFGNVNHSH